MSGSEVTSLGWAKPASSYLWEVPGKPISIHLSQDAIDRILFHALAGLGRVLKGRGAEVGGILVGSAENEEGRQVVRIEDFEPVPCQHAFGPSFVLSDADRQMFEEALEKWRAGPDRRLYAVGFCRTNTRAQLALRPEDLQLFSAYFPDPSHVALIVRPRASGAGAAGFFFWEGGQVRSDASYLEFPFQGRIPRPSPPDEEFTESGVSRQPRPGRHIRSSPALVAESDAKGNGARETASPGEDAGEDLEPEGMPAFRLTLLDSAPRRPMARRLWIPLLVLLAAASALLWTRHTQITAPAPERDHYTLSLVAQELEGNLRVTWDRKAPAIEAAERGALTITDGDQLRSLLLSRSQLQNGSVIYRRITSQVKLRLDIFFPRGNVLSESQDFTSPDKAANPASEPVGSPASSAPPPAAGQ